jgi:hypothetical protein
LISEDGRSKVEEEYGEFIGTEGRLGCGCESIGSFVDAGCGRGAPVFKFEKSRGGLLLV